MPENRLPVYLKTETSRELVGVAFFVDKAMVIVMEGSDVENLQQLASYGRVESLVLEMIRRTEPSNHHAPSASELSLIGSDAGQVRTEADLEQRRLQMQGMSRPNWRIGALVKVVDPTSSYCGATGTVYRLHDDNVLLDFGLCAGAFSYYMVGLVSNTTIDERRKSKEV